MIANGVSEQLLTHLQKELGRPALSYAEPPTRITGGFDTTIYSLRLDGVAVPYDKPLVLRVFRSDSDPRRAEFEALVQNTIASQGYPAPRTLLWSTDTAALGGAFMLMDRIPGVTMLDLFLRPSLALFRLPAALADAQAALHALNPQPLVSAIAASGLSNFMSGLNTSLVAMRNLVERYSLEGLRSGIAWLEEQRPPPGSPTICHGDFHPLNLLNAAAGKCKARAHWPGRSTRLRGP